MNFAINQTAASNNAANAFRPAQAFLIEAGIPQAWDIYQHPGNAATQEEVVLRDIVFRLEQKGELSEKQTSYLRVLVDRIANAAARKAQWAAEAASAAPVPTGRMEFTGTILTVKGVETRFGFATKVLVQTAAGWKAWGTLPSAASAAQKGDTLTLTATLEASKDDAKFGFFSRPTGARITRAQ